MLFLKFSLTFVLFLLGVRCQNEDRTIKFSLLNEEETITMTLANYFSFPAQVQIDYMNSTEGITDILNITFTDRPVTEVSRLQLTAVDPQGISIDFNAYTLIKQRSVFNHPNKVFLMEGNVFFSIRYQVSFSDNNTYVQVYKITEKDRNCSQLEIQNLNNSYYLHVACISRSGNTIYIHSYKFKDARPDLLSQLNFIGVKEVSTGPNCVRVLLYAYSQLYVSKTKDTDKVILFCTETTGGASQPKITYLLSIINIKGVESVNVTSKDDQQLTRCLQNATQIFFYQTGFISLAKPWLRYYSFNRAYGITYCDKNFTSVVGMTFLAEVQQIGIQYIYIINRTQIKIKQSYSPNFEMITIDESHIQGMDIVDYAIARRLLMILYENDTDYALMAFDLHTSFPKLVDIVEYSKNNTEVKLFSVKNYLTISNYFVIYHQDTNTFELNLYIGYELTVSINDSSQAIGSMIIALTDDALQSLKLNFTFRDFNDLTLHKSSSVDIMLYQQFFNMKLSDYIIGPLGRFYNYPNKISAFEYINHQHVLNIGNKLSAVKQNIVAFSTNNELSRPILNFYFDNHTILSCELDYDLDRRETNLEQCKTTKTHQSILNQNLKVIALSQQFYLQYDNNTLEFCELSSGNGEYLCSSISIGFKTSIANIKLVKYSSSESEQEIGLMMYGPKEILYCTLTRPYLSVYFLIYVNYHIKESNNKDLATMQIVDLYFDKGYRNFLVLYLADNILGKKVIVYEKPLIANNSYSALIGHVIEVFDRIELEALFCLENLLILVTKQNGDYSIRQYKVTKEYRLKFNRAYPLYDYTVREGGSHSINQNFIFLAVSKGLVNYTIVYCPLLPSSNLLVHRIATQQKQLLLSQQIHPIKNSSLMLLGKDLLIGITLPSLVFEFTKRAQELDMTIYQFSIGVVDSLQQSSILTYKFSYNQKEEEIDYLDQDDFEINLNSTHPSHQFSFDSNNIYGSVMDYKISLPNDEDECSGIQVTRKDLFTKQKCLLYYQTLYYGKLHDFAAITIDNSPIELVVTDKALFCVKNRRMPNEYNPDFDELQDCTFIIVDNNVLMICTNSSTSARKLFNLTISQTQKECKVDYRLVNIPQSLVYEDFNVMVSQQYVVFEVPIRLQNNMIYYKSKYDEQGVSSVYSLLRRQKGPNVYQTQFQSIDSFFSGDLLLLLEEGIGIYNISNSKSTISPAMWINASQLDKISEEEMVYIKFISLTCSQSDNSLVIELGTTKSSVEVEILFKVEQSSTPEQTVYSLIDIRNVFEYIHYPYCQNSAHSKSQRYKNLIVKICDYTPVKNNVFANFISINNDTSSSLLQFYNRSGSATTSAAIRTELIYSSTISDQEITIRGDEMIVGSLFNLLCYYQLQATLSWTISHEQSYNDHQCTAELLMFNKHYSMSKQIKISYDSFAKPNYWTVISLYPQRLILLLILINTIRLMVGRRSYLQVLRRKQKPTQFSHDNKFEVMVKINSKRNI